MFSWWRRTDVLRIVDPELGELRLEVGAWWGETASPADGRPVLLIVADAGGRPAAGAKQALDELVQRYPALRPGFAVELRRLLEPWHADISPDTPLESGEPLLARFHVSSIEVAPTGVAVIEFELNEGWDDAGFRVGLDGWVPTGLGVDD